MVGILITLLIIGILFCFACCKVAGICDEEDERIEELIKELEENDEANNNNKKRNNIRKGS